MLLPDKIRQAISSLHTEIEATPLAKEMLAGTISRSAYACWIVEMYRVHAALERALAGAPEQAAVFDPATMARSGLLLSDAGALGLTAPESGHATVDQVVTHLDRLAREEPWGLVGALYVLEGSRMGSLALIGPLARALGARPNPGAGLDYHLDGATERPRRWRAFREEVGRLAVSADQEEAIVGAAVFVMRALVAMYSAPTGPAARPAERSRTGAEEGYAVAPSS